MYFHHSKVKGLLEFIRWVHTHPPWEDPKGFFNVLHQVIPCDYSLTFMKMDPTTYKIVPFPLTLSNGGGDDPAVIRDYNDHFWQFKKPILDRIMKRQFQAFHVPNTLKTYLPKAQFEEFQTDFWQKHKIRFCYVRYMKTPQGWFGIYLARYLGARDFSEEEEMCLDLLAPHVELVAAHGDSESLCLFADAQGQILTLDPQAETMFQSMPAFAARLRTVLPGWIRECSSKPLKPFRVDIQDRGLIYHFRISPAGTGRSPLFRVSWTSSKPEPPLPASVLGAFALQYRLSPRERDVLACAVTGKQMKEMAQQLGLAVDTVKEYLGSLYHKVGVDGRGPLVAKILSQVAFAPLTTLPSPLDNTELL